MSPKVGFANVCSIAGRTSMPLHGIIVDFLMTGTIATERKFFPTKPTGIHSNKFAIANDFNFLDFYRGEWTDRCFSLRLTGFA